MARGVARTGSGRPVFSELQHNGEPPRSTLAAQLVNHFTDGKKHSRNQDQETFRQLLQEVLGGEEEQHPRTEAIETDSIVIPKLLDLTGKSQECGITDRVIQILQASLINEKKVHSKERKLNLVLKYLRGCTKGQYIVLFCELSS